MDGKFYSSERNIQILISLLKAHGIKKIVTSPGATNLSFVASLMQDSWFEMYSSVDERSAAYIACGLASESGEPVVLTCTGATASRNYIPGLTEAFYRKLPVIAVTSTQDISKIGHLVAQVIDRREQMNDICLLSEHINVVNNETQEWDANVKINRAILELRHRGGGPVHLNLTTTYSRDYSVKELPKARVIHRIEAFDEYPELPQGRIGIFVGAHQAFTEEQTKAIDNFCAAHDAVVFCDHTSGYYGEYRIQTALIKVQANSYNDLTNMDLLIHIGEVSGDYSGMNVSGKQVWRVNRDGAIRDFWHKLTYVFEMPEEKFFEHYTPVRFNTTNARVKELCLAYNAIYDRIPELPFSNTWIAQQTAHRLPKNSVLHLGILNSLRNWNFFKLSEGIRTASNTGGFGIDGILSTLVGASLSNPNQLHFVVLGDLAFFYDMNVAGNRHVGNNVRILLVNNGKGTEFRNYNHPGAAFGEEADKFIAAGGHYGNKSPLLVKHYAEDLGYEYLTASTKEEYLKVVERFLTSGLCDKPMLFEVFTTEKDESDALEMMANIDTNAMTIAKNVAGKVLGNKGKEALKKLLGR